MSTKVPEGFIEDAKGRFIPENQVREIDKQRDALVKGLIAEAKNHAGNLAMFREAAEHAIQEFVQESATKFKVKLGGKKGHVQLISYDGQYKVLLALHDRLVFDERLIIAKELVDKCIKAWSGGADTKLMALVNKAFAVDSEGNVNAKKVLELKQLSIDDANWRKAMEAISQATQVISTKSYVRFYERQDNGEYKNIPLNIAAE
jgi:hypothetical protein